MALARGFRLPLEFKVLHARAALIPQLPVLDDLLECQQPGERDQDAVVHIQPVEQGDHLVAKEGPVQAGLDTRPGQCLPDMPCTAVNEGLGTIGVMHVARPMKDIEHD